MKKRGYNKNTDEKKEVIVMAQVTKDTMIGELLQMDMNIAQILFECGMHCPGCPSARFETLEEAAFVHGFDCALLVEKINAYLAAK